VAVRARVYVPTAAAIVAVGLMGQALVASASAGQVPRHRAVAAARGSAPFTITRRGNASELRDAAVASSGPGSFGTALVGSVSVPVGPGGVAVDAATDTIYVASGNNPNGAPVANPPDTITVINGSQCQASNVARCEGPWPTVTVGDLPGAVTVDQATDTVYVANYGDNTVSVINGATCNAHDDSGCGQTPATVPVGNGPSGIFADQANHTVYVANFNDSTVSMINSATCNGSDFAGCPSQPPPTVAVGTGPGDVDVNEVTHSVYVTILTGLSVFAEKYCNATVQAGCGNVGEAVAPGVGTPACTDVDPPCGGFSAMVDVRNNTIYEADGTTTVTVFDGRTCQASDLAGCAAAQPGTVTVAPPNDVGFEVSIWIAVDAPLHTVYVVNQKDDDLAVINASICNGTDLTGCGTLSPPTIHTGEDPESVALNPKTQTLYTANQVTGDVSVIDASQCNATVTSGCRQAPTSVAVPNPVALAADPAASTVYAAAGTDTVSMIDSRTCNANVASGCAATPPIATVGQYPTGIAVDPQTHTVYVANSGSAATGSVSVLDDRTCNATTTSGCSHARTLQVPGGNPIAIALDPATDTIYVATLPASGPSTISVFNGATCNSGTGSGCGQLPQSVTVGFWAYALAVNVTTDTVYVANWADSNDTPFAGNTVSVIDGTACNATTSTGCGNAPQTISLGPAFTSPDGVAVDQGTDTIYIADLQNGEESGTVSVINGATCDGAISTGCGQVPPTVTTGFGPAAIAFDPVSGTVVVANIEDASVSVIDAATCNATITSSCGQPQPKVPAGRAPNSVAVDAATGTIYTSNGDNTVSVIPMIR
jgi:DNA-binding beta-propeller fold protein YncE